MKLPGQFSVTFNKLGLNTKRPLNQAGVSHVQPMNSLLVNCFFAEVLCQHIVNDCTVFVAL